MSLHARSVTSSWFGRNATRSVLIFRAVYCGNQGFMWREPQWILLLAFLCKRLVVMSMKLQFCGDAANIVFQSPTWANSNHPAICSFFFSSQPIHKAIIDTVTYCAPCKQKSAHWWGVVWHWSSQSHQDADCINKVQCFLSHSFTLCYNVSGSGSNFQQLSLEYRIFQSWNIKAQWSEAATNDRMPSLLIVTGFMYWV